MNDEQPALDRLACLAGRSWRVDELPGGLTNTNLRIREADEGAVSVLGLPPWPRNPRLLPRIGVQLQASSFFERLTAREQLQTFGSLYGVPARKADAMRGGASGGKAVEGTLLGYSVRLD